MSIPVHYHNVKRAFVNASSSGDNELVAAPAAGTKIRVLSVVAVAGVSANTLTFRSATTAVSAGFPFAANGGMALSENPNGWFQTAAGEALNVNLSGASLVAVSITYILVTN
jgi:hypothetical protein